MGVLFLCFRRIEDRVCMGENCFKTDIAAIKSVDFGDRRCASDEIEIQKKRENADHREPVDALFIQHKLGGESHDQAA